MPVTLDWTGWDIEGNLALDFEALDDNGGDKPLVSCSEKPNTSNEREGDAGQVSNSGRTPEPPVAIPETAPATFLFPARYKAPRLDKLTRDSILRAFKRSCSMYHVSFTVGEDDEGRSRVKLDAPMAEQGRLGFEALRCELEAKPWIEAALLLELAQKDAELAYILDERAAIQAENGLSDDAETIALMTIGASERMAAREAERTEFEMSIIRKGRKGR